MGSRFSRRTILGLSLVGVILNNRSAHTIDGPIDIVVSAHDTADSDSPPHAEARADNTTADLWIGLFVNLHAQSAGSVAILVLAYFEQLSKERRLDDYLTLARPTPVSMTYKAAALANLPPSDNVQLSAKMQAKLAALAPILEFFDRKNIIEPKVIGDNETTFVGLYERCVLIITQKALDLLSQQEIQAVVAHELAHEWYWDEYRLARESKQDDKVQEIELRCDGIAILALVRLRLNPSQIISALRKMSHYDQNTRGANYYAAPDERLTFARSMIKMINRISTCPRSRVAREVHEAARGGEQPGRRRGRRSRRSPDPFSSSSKLSR